MRIFVISVSLLVSAVNSQLLVLCCEEIRHSRLGRFAHLVFQVHCGRAFDDRPSTGL